MKEMEIDPDIGKMRYVIHGGARSEADFAQT